MAKFGRRGSRNESYEAAVQEIKAALPSAEVSEFVLEDVPLDLVDRDEGQPRPLHEVMDGIEAFADELERDNFKLAQYPVFHIEDNGRRTIVIGERRTTAFKLKGRATIPAVCKRFTEKEREELFVLQYAENDGKLKKELSPLADAKWWQNYIERFHDGNASRAAEARGRTAAEVSNRLSLLKSAPMIQEFVQRNDLKDPATFAALNRLMKVAGAAAVQRVIESYEEGLVPGSLRQYTEKLAREVRKVKQATAAVEAQKPESSEVPREAAAPANNEGAADEPPTPLNENEARLTKPSRGATSLFEKEAAPTAQPSKARMAIHDSAALLDKAEFQAALLEQNGSKEPEEYRQLLGNLKAAIGHLEKAYSAYDAELALALAEQAQ